MPIDGGLGSRSAISGDSGFGGSANSDREGASHVHAADVVFGNPVWKARQVCAAFL